MRRKLQISIVVLLSAFLLVFNISFIFAQEKDNIWQNFLEALRAILFKQQTENSQYVPKVNNSQLYQSNVELEQSIINAVENVSPAVVSIVISKYVPIIEKYYINPFEDLPIPPELKPFFQFEFPIPQYQEKGLQRQKVGAGTGFIVKSDGLIVTNKHVVNDPKAEYTVYLKDGKKYQAKVLAVHPRDDLALLKIEAQGLPIVKLGDSDQIRLGQFVLAIGNALGEFQNTVTLGIISGTNRTVVASDGTGNVEKLTGMLQTDAAINFGNSGGPLLNLKGEVIGVSTAIASQAQNIGFAIPINRVKRMIQEVEEKGKIEVPFLGVRYILITPEIQTRFNLSVDYGAYIYSSDPQLPAVISNSPASKIGLRAGDIILSVDGEKVTPENTLSDLISNKEVGQSIRLEILRGDQKILRMVKLEAMPEDFLAR